MKIRILICLTFALLVTAATPQTSSDQVTSWAAEISNAVNQKLFADWGGFDYFTHLVEDKLSYTVVHTDGKPQLAGLAAQVQTIMLEYASALESLRQMFETNWVNRKAFPDINPVNATGFSNWNINATNGAYQALISDATSAVHFPNSWNAQPQSATGEREMKDILKIAKTLDSSMIENMHQPKSQIIYQYFGSRQGLTSFFPARSWNEAIDPNYAATYQPWYIRGATGPKDIVLVIDASRGFEGQNALLIKEAVTKVVSGLSPEDYLQVLFVDQSRGILSAPCFPFNSASPTNRLVRTTAENVIAFQNFVASMNNSESGEFDLDSGVNAAVQLLNYTSSIHAGSSCNQFIIVVSLEGGRLETVRSAVVHSGAQLAFYSFGAPDTETRLIACRSSGGYRKIDASNAVSAIGDYYRFLAAAVPVKDVQWIPKLVFVPGFSGTFGLVIAASVAVYDTSTIPHEFLGVIGMDIACTEIYRIIDSVRSGMTYSALVSLSGDAVLHPAFKSFGSITSPPHMLDISYLEVVEFETYIRESLLTELVGSDKRVVKRHLPNWAQNPGLLNFDGIDLLETETVWNWQRLIGLPYVLFTISATSDLNRVIYNSNNDTFVYTYAHTSGKHYPDSLFIGLDPPIPDPIRSTPEKPAVMFRDLLWKFGARAYEDADFYLQYGDSTVEFSRSVNAYVNELFAPNARQNPGLLPSSKTVARAFSSMNTYWRNSAADPAKAKYLAATAATYLGHDSSYIGVWPGLPDQIPNWYDPSARGWYVRSKGQPYSACFTTPYFDAFGAGSVTSITRTVWADGAPVGVLGFDFLYPQVHELILQNTGCHLPNANPNGPRCYTITNAGLTVLTDIFLETNFLTDVSNGVVSALNFFIGSPEPELARQLMEMGFLTFDSNPSWFSGTNSTVFNVNDDVLNNAPNGILSGTLKGMGTDCTSGAWKLIKIPVTNAYLIVIDNWVQSNSKPCVSFTAPPPNSLVLDNCEESGVPRFREPQICPVSDQPVSSAILLEAYRLTDANECAYSYKELEEVNEGIRIAMTVVAAILVVFWSAVGIMVFRWRNRSILKFSSPLFCEIIILGGIVLIASVWPWFPSPITTSGCLGYLWLFVLGATLAITPIFLKSWRVYMLFDARDRYRITNISNTSLVILVGGFLLLDCLYLAIWTGVDPWVAGPNYNILNDEAKYVITCESDHFDVWIGIVIGWFGFQMLICCVLAFLTRKLAQSFSDARLIGLVIYTVSGAAAVIVPLVFLLDFVPDAVYLIRHLGTMVVTSLCLAIFFFPKLWVIISGAPGSAENDDNWFGSKLRKSTTTTVGSSTTQPLPTSATNTSFTGAPTTGTLSD